MSASHPTIRVGTVTPEKLEGDEVQGASGITPFSDGLSLAAISAPPPPMDHPTDAPAIGIDFLIYGTARLVALSGHVIQGSYQLGCPACWFIPLPFCIHGDHDKAL